MVVLDEAVFAKFIKKHRDAAGWLRDWVEITRASTWHSIVDVRKIHSSADGIHIRRGSDGLVVTVFNVKGNKYRLITTIDYGQQTVFIHEMLTHAEYNSGSWKSRL